MSKFKNIFSLSNIENADGCGMCSEMSGYGAPHDCKHGHILCSICHGSVHAHGILSMRNHKREDTYKEDSGYFEGVSSGNIIDNLNDKAALGIVRMTLDSHYFFGICWRDSGLSGFWHMSSYIAGESRYSAKYIFRVSICDQTCIEEISYRGECLPLDIEKNEIVSSGRCLTFNDETVRRYCTDGKLKFYFEIRSNADGN